MAFLEAFRRRVARYIYPLEEVVAEHTQELIEENRKLRIDAAQVFVEDMRYIAGNFEASLHTPIGLALAEFVKATLEKSNAENFVTGRIEFPGKDERYYMAFGRCLGKSAEEKYMEKCDEVDRLQAQIKALTPKKRTAKRCKA